MVLPLILGWLMTSLWSALAGILGVGIIAGLSWLFIKSFVLPTVVVIASVGAGLFLLYKMADNLSSGKEIPAPVWLGSLVLFAIFMSAPLWVNSLLSGLSMAPIQSTATFSMADLQSTASAPATGDNFISASKPYLVASAFGVLVGLMLYAMKGSKSKRRL